MSALTVELSEGLVRDLVELLDHELLAGSHSSVLHHKVYSDEYDALRELRDTLDA